ncbi:GtrA family protein [Weissella cibaria]|nr:GtrA family protein [Weissella cibaria]
MLKFIQKNMSIISYIFFGGLTTLVSLGSYSLFIVLFHMNYQISNILSWILSVTFAYFTNKHFVFKSQPTSSRESLKQILSFFSARISTLILEIIILWVGITLLHGNEYVWKFIDQIIILVANYAASKVIFNKK